MFIALRRFTLLCTIVLERVMMNKRHDRSTLGAVAIMIGGAPWHLPRLLESVPSFRVVFHQACSRFCQAGCFPAFMLSGAGVRALQHLCCIP